MKKGIHISKNISQTLQIQYLLLSNLMTSHGFTVTPNKRLKFYEIKALVGILGYSWPNYSVHMTAKH